ncbi:pentatricopeptide repeat-containing protein At4g18520, chloroplastic [Rhodamnia argentea]|uniref:Pentatricopeptide repeat-containing protein At4g18520, chloroplastic n=1 Tax=Rhodamnia argentea TaxID=178133 RepID=A0A8B8Q335_9MYRT|nr:pentatricopeptide repeat-containing protein At4g18520, chloroplastic [Rhodamnia argentea]
MSELLKPILRERSSNQFRQMLSSYTFLSPILASLNTPVSLLCQKPQTPKHSLYSKARKGGDGRFHPSFSIYLSSTSKRCFSSNVSCFQENPDGDLRHGPSGEQCINDDLLASWLQSCSSVTEVQKVQAAALKCSGSGAAYVGNNLMSAYLRYGRLDEVRKVFDEMPERNVVSWTTMINACVRFGLDSEALRLFLDALGDGVRANCKTYVCILNLCCRRLDFQLGKQVHACVIKNEQRNLIVESAIVHFYAQCGMLDSAFCAFDRMNEHDVVSWTTIITACSQQGHGTEAFSMFGRMLRDGLLPNGHTVCSILNVCGEEQALKCGRQLHCITFKRMIKNDVFVWTSLVDMYAKCGEIVDSRKVFDAMKNRNTVTWTTMIAGYARNWLGEEAIDLFREMKRRNIFANNLTIVSILLACGSIKKLELGREVHAQILKKSIQTNVHIGSTLVWLYCKYGNYSFASNVLRQMPFRDVVSWTALISGCTHLGLGVEALERLKDMLDEGVEPNAFTYSSALKACAKLEDLLQGKLLHSSANKTPALSNVFVGSALIHMYAKCGYLAEASQVFDSMPQRNLVTWKAMIMGYARTGYCREALKLMYRMRAEGIEVDDYVLATVITACGDLEWDKEPSSEYCLQSS